MPPTLDADLKDPKVAAEGKDIFESVGCKACHTVDKEGIGTPVGSFTDFKPNESRTTKDFAPNLSAIAEKTNGRLDLPLAQEPARFLAAHRDAVAAAFGSRGFGAGRVPDDDGEQETRPERRADPGSSPMQIAKGKSLVRKYGCFGCHEINGMEKESRIGVELTTFGSKHLDELFFGNQTDIPNTWDAWTYHKLYTPRIYATADVEQLMPNFEFQDTDIRNLRVFLASLIGEKVPERYRAPGSAEQQDIVNGRRMVNFYNCVGCHIIEQRGGYIRRFYEQNPNFAPPILNGEGAKGPARLAVRIPPGADADPALAEAADADLPLHQYRGQHPGGLLRCHRQARGAVCLRQHQRHAARRSAGG